MIDIHVIPQPLKQHVSGWPWETPQPIPEAGGTLPKISIVVPSYFRGDFLEETLRSILLQSYPNLEVIVMDGGSTDATVQILEYYDACITYWESKKDKGQSDGVNKGFKRCTGDIITFQNSDDIYMPGTFHTVARLYAENPRAGVFAGGFYFMSAKSERMGEDIPPYLNVTAPADLTLGPSGAYRIHQNSVFFTKTAMDDVGRFVRDDLDFTMDRELLYRIVRKYPVVLTDQLFGAFRKHPDSKSTHSIRPFAAEWARLHREFKNGDPEEDKQRESMARYRLYRGEVQFAKLADRKSERIVALLNAARFYPGALFTRSFLRLFVQVFFNKLPQD